MINNELFYEFEPIYYGGTEGTEFKLPRCPNKTLGKFKLEFDNLPVIVFNNIIVNIVYNNNYYSIKKYKNLMKKKELKKALKNKKL